MSEKQRPTQASPANGQVELPIAIRYGKAIADAGWSAIPNLLLDFFTFLRFGKERILDQEALLLTILLRRKRDNADPAVLLRDVRTQKPYSTRRRWVWKLKRMGVLFTRQVFHLPEGTTTPRVLYTEFDFENLFDNLLAIHAVWLEGRDKHQAQGRTGSYVLPEDFTWQIRLFPSTAARIVAGYYGRVSTEAAGGVVVRKVYGVSQHWVNEAFRMAEAGELSNFPDVHQFSPGPGVHQFSPGPDVHQFSPGVCQMFTSARSYKESLRYLTVPLEDTNVSSSVPPGGVPPPGAGSARIASLPLLDEIVGSMTLEDQADLVAFWLRKLEGEGRSPQAIALLTKVFGRAFGFWRDGGGRSAEPEEADYSRLGGLCKEFGGPLAVWAAACRMLGRDIDGDPINYLHRCLIQERKRLEEAQGHGSQRRQRGKSQGDGYRRLPRGEERDYLGGELSRFVER